jgi:exosortase family protein XrtF
MPISNSIFLFRESILLKELLSKYRDVFRFIILFFGVYLVLYLFYGLYLDLSEGGNYKPDYITNLVARQSSSLIAEFGYNAKVIPHETNTSMKLFIDENFLARIVEGCNGISIIILFIAFVVAFSEKLKKTLLFVFAGSVLIYGFNIIRISIITIALHKYSQYETFLHEIVFPGLIYGLVFLLWLIWVRMLSSKKINNE